ncbi:MAG: hypothetical protein EA399_11515 [Desulfovibrionales bacterium]|nr:MAG: hypothetical protein EA399_11515 [Desulfovibrionales bacterium]
MLAESHKVGGSPRTFCSVIRDNIFCIAFFLQQKRFFKGNRFLVETTPFALHSSCNTAFLLINCHPSLISVWSKKFFCSRLILGKPEISMTFL